jgi:hypothetical protein
VGGICDVDCGIAVVEAAIVAIISRNNNMMEVLVLSRLGE